MSLGARVEERDKVARFGFWLYIMSDVMLFGALFATYMILRHNTAGGPTTLDIVEPPYVLIQTILLTGLLGLGFFALEINEFITLAVDGHTWQTSAFLSAFFTLVGTHGAHILVGLIWLSVLLWLVHKRGLTPNIERKLGLFALFWHFLDIVWIFIFAIVYMYGVGVV